MHAGTGIHKGFGPEPVIPYPENQMRVIEGLLRADRRFRVHGPKGLMRRVRRSCNSYRSSWQYGKRSNPLDEELVAQASAIQAEASARRADSNRICIIATW